VFLGARGGDHPFVLWAFVVVASSLAAAAASLVYGLTR
jgi:hypothetical protein